MQPETKEKQKFIKVGPEYVPAGKDQRDPSPAEQWDHVAFRLIQQELAPKGYSEIKRGPWRGKVKSNLEFLPKQTVVNCQKISAQLIRTFRGKTVKVLTTSVGLIDDQIKEYQNEVKESGFFQFGKRHRLKSSIKTFEYGKSMLELAINELNNLPIK